MAYSVRNIEEHFMLGWVLFKPFWFVRTTHDYRLALRTPNLLHIYVPQHESPEKICQVLIDPPGKVFTVVRAKKLPQERQGNPYFGTTLYSCTIRMYTLSTAWAFSYYEET